MNRTQAELLAEIEVLRERVQNLEAEHQRLKYLTAAFEGCAEGIALVDMEGRLQMLNPAFADMYGTKGEEWLGRHFSVLYHDRQMPVVEDAIRRLKETGSYSTEIEHLRRDGTPFTAAMRCSLLYDESGQPMNIILFVRDITTQKQSEASLQKVRDEQEARIRQRTAELTEVNRRLQQEIRDREQAEQARQESTEMARALLNATTESALLLEADGTIVTLNQTAAERLGGSVDDLIGTNIFALLPPELAATRKAQVQKVLDTGRPLRLVDQRAGRCFDSHFYPVFNRRGQVTRIAVFAIDITEHKRAEEALAAERKLLETVVDNLPEYIFAKDTQGRFVFVNQAVVDYYHLAGKEDMYGKTDFDIMDHSLAQRYADEEKEILDHVRPMINRENQAPDLSGCMRWYLSTKIPWRDDKGHLLGLVGMNHEITEHKNAERRLIEERNLLRALIDALPYPIYVKDTQSRFILANQETARLLKVEKEADLLGKTDFDFAEHSLASQLYVDEQTLMRTGRPLVGLETETWDGRWISITKVPFHDSQGNVAGLIGMNLNITERKRAEETMRRAHEELERRVAERTAELRETNEKLRQEIAEREKIEQALRRSEEAERRFQAQLTALLEISIALSQVEQIDDLCRKAVELGNRQLAFDRLGIWFTTDEPMVMVGSYAIDEKGRLRDERHVRRIQQREDVQACLDSTRPIAFRTEGPLHDLEGRVVGEGIRISAAIWDGQKTIGYLSGDNLLTQRALTEHDGELLALYASVLGHLCVRLRAENALRESEEQYRTLYETAIVGLWRTRIDNGLFIKCNRTMATLIGYSDPREVVDKVSTLDIYPAERRQELLNLLHKHGSVSGHEIRLRRKDGREIDTSMSACIFPEKGYIEGAILDITETKRLQQQLLQAQKLESIGTLAGGIAHDFNNLLAVIIGNASVLGRRSSLPAKVRAALDDIVEAAERGASLTHQLLAYARGGLQKPVPTDLNQVVKSVLQIFRRATPPQIDLVRQLDTDLPAIVADPIQIEQVTMNLCLNAVQASSTPSVIEIRTFAAQLDESRAAAWKRDPGLYVCLQVEDHGCGMDPATAQRIFEPFFTTKSSGRGMGLAAAHGIVESHQGHIEVDTQPGRGTIMTVWLPAAQQPPQAPTSLAAEIGTMQAPRGTETVLFIDDDPAVAKTVERILSPLGYIVITHTDTDEATAFMNSNSEDIELVLLDLNMPKCSGAEMYQRIAQRCPHAPVILVSGFDKPDIVETLRQQGAVDFLQKPFSIVKLATAIRKALDERKPGESKPSN